MSCLSDIDLATLHQLRLNERVDYKLSWLNRPSVVQRSRDCEQQQQQQQPKTKVQADQRRTVGNRKTNKTAKDGRNQCVEHVKNDANGTHRTFPKSSGHQSRRQCINSIDTNSKNVCVRSYDECGAGSCDIISCKSKIAHRTIRQYDSNANKLCCKSINGVVNERPITIDDDHFPILRRRRSGTWP